MEDAQIVKLYWARQEAAISETEKKYGRYCYRIAQNILHNDGDSEECVNDTYMRAWNSMPPHRPAVLKAFLGKITRNLSLDKFSQKNAEKRGGGQVTLILDEMRECTGTAPNTETVIDEIFLTELLDGFLASLSVTQRKIFMRRYWYFCSVKEIAKGLDMSESKVKTSLFRSRNKLKLLLEKEGVLV